MDAERCLDSILRGVSIRCCSNFFLRRKRRKTFHSIPFQYSSQLDATLQSMVNATDEQASAENERR